MRKDGLSHMLHGLTKAFSIQQRVVCTLNVHRHHLSDELAFQALCGQELL
jgi:hypothetical protein